MPKGQTANALECTANYPNLRVSHPVTYQTLMSREEQGKAFSRGVAALYAAANSGSPDEKREAMERARVEMGCTGTWEDSMAQTFQQTLASVRSADGADSA